MKKKQLTITAIILVLALSIMFIRPLSFYIVLASHGYNVTNIEKLEAIEETKDGKAVLLVGEDHNGEFNLMILSNQQSLLWYIQKSGKISTDTETYSWIQWDQWNVKDDGTLTSKAHKTLIYPIDSNIHIITDDLPTTLDYRISEHKNYRIIDIYSISSIEKDLNELDIEKLIIG